MSNYYKRGTQTKDPSEKCLHMWVLQKCIFFTSYKDSKVFSGNTGKVELWVEGLYG